MVKLSVEIADSVAPDLEGKLKAATELGIHNIEISDCVDGKTLYEMNGAEDERIRNLLIDFNMRVVLVSTGLRPDDRDAWKILMRRCMLLDVEAVKIDVSKGEDTTFVKRIIDSFGVELCVENCAGGSIADENAIFEAVREHGARVIFNPLEIVKTECHPFLNTFTAGKFKNDIGFLRINDGLYRTHESVMLSHGCTEIKELASILLCRSFKGYFSFVPYMAETDLNVYRENIATLKNLLKNC